MALEYPQLSASWSRQFINRHTHLKTVISRSIEASRIKEVTKDVILNFFDVFERCLENHQITLDNVYNMDETGTALS